VPAALARHGFLTLKPVEGLPDLLAAIEAGDPQVDRMREIPVLNHQAAPPCAASIM
jgi:hypothetical protein